MRKKIGGRVQWITTGIVVVILIIMTVVMAINDNVDEQQTSSTEGVIAENSVE